jgi:acyl dehydratase
MGCNAMLDLPLLWTILKNLRADAVNRKKIGHTETAELPPVSAREAAAFAAATGDPNPAYAAPGGPLPPLYIAKLVIPSLKRIWQLPGLRMNLLRTVHAAQTVRWHRLPTSGTPLRVRMTLSGVQDTRAGELVEVFGCCYADGKKAVEGVTGLLVRSKDRRSSGKGPIACPAAERFRVGIPTREGQQMDYARVSGDRNFIHTSELLARAAGLPRTILHGACVLAMACRVLTDAVAGGDIDRIDEIGCRFARPVIPGTHLTLVGYQSADRLRVPFVVLDGEDRPALSNGHFSHR